MAKARYWWYQNVCAIIREYPEMRQREAQLRGRERKDYAAVCRAIDRVTGWPTGKEIMAVVQAKAWESGKKSLGAIAREEYMSERTATRRYSRFVYTVADELGYKMG